MTAWLKSPIRSVMGTRASGLFGCSVIGRLQGLVPNSQERLKQQMQSVRIASRHLWANLEWTIDFMSPSLPTDGAYSGSNADRSSSADRWEFNTRKLSRIAMQEDNS